VGHIVPMMEMKNACRMLICIHVNVNIELALLKAVCVCAVDSSGQG
jgi:hypothetical protein